jgi:hypothetical protein
MYDLHEIKVVRQATMVSEFQDCEDYKQHKMSGGRRVVSSKLKARSCEYNCEFSGQGNQAGSARYGGRKLNRRLTSNTDSGD